jgi:hypothetical protein
MRLLPERQGLPYEKYRRQQNARRKSANSTQANSTQHIASWQKAQTIKHQNIAQAKLSKPAKSSQEKTTGRSRTRPEAAAVRPELGSSDSARSKRENCEPCTDRLSAEVSRKIQ